MHWKLVSAFLGQGLSILERTQLMVETNSGSGTEAERMAADAISKALDPMLAKLTSLALECTPVKRQVAKDLFEVLPPSIVSSYKQNGILV